MKPTPPDELFLSASQRKKLDAVYRKAEYLVQLEGSKLTFFVDHYDPAAERALFAQMPVRREWAVLTPCNPRSQEATREANVFYYQELRDALASSHSLWLPATNHDPMGSWQDEPGFAIADAEPAKLRELGLRFMQNAYVTAKIGEPLKLVWLV